MTNSKSPQAHQAGRPRASSNSRPRSSSIIMGVNSYQASHHQSLALSLNLNTDSVEEHKPYSFRERLLIFSYMYGNFFLAACVSLQAPFFPREAQDKGASSTEYGFVFGIYELAIILVSPLVGKLVGQSSPRLWIQFGLLLTGASTILFGFLDKAPHGRVFLFLALAIRVLEGIGAASFTTPSYTATAEEFPESQATILSLLETSFGLGLICGPTLGGWLYELDGYTLPFLTLGSFLILGALINLFATIGRPSVAYDPKEPQAAYMSVLFSPGILLDAFCVITSLLFIGFNAATLEPHLRQFDLSVMTIGSIFVITGTIYALVTPIWGKLCRLLDTRLLCLVGCIACLAGYAIIGPLPVLADESSLLMTLTALVLIGLGTGIKLVAALVGSFKYAIHELGMPDNKSTFGVCSSIYHTSTSIGAFIGPSIGGFLLDHVGYRQGTYLLFVSEFVLIVFLINFLLRRLVGASVVLVSEQQPAVTNKGYSRLVSQENGNTSKDDHHSVTGETLVEDPAEIA